MDVKNDLYALNDINKIDGNSAEFKKKMCEMVDLLSDARQLSELK